MSFNRNKILANAQKLLQKGKISEAIREYEEVVHNDPLDIRTLLKIGDLHAKQGNIEGATSTYQKVGEFYAKDGFFLKAVAVFKQILKLDPGLILVYVRLAQLYQNLGLNSDAIKQYQVVARHYESQGLIKESLDILQKMSELEPDNIANRIKLAELYCREGHKEDGQKQFFSIVTQLESKKNYPELVRVYEKILALEIQDENIEIKLIEAYLSNSEAKKALIRLQKLFQKNPRNIPVLNLLAQCFIDLSQPEKSKSVYVEILNILEKENRQEEKDKYVAKLRTLNVVSQSSPPIVAGHDSYSISNVSTSSAPQPIKTPEKILEEVDTFIQYGLMEKALQLLEESVSQNLEDSSLRERLYLIAKDCEKSKAEVVLLNLSKKAFEAGKPDIKAEFDECAKQFTSEDTGLIELSEEMVRPGVQSAASGFEFVDDVSTAAPPAFVEPAQEAFAKNDGDVLDDIAFDFNDDPQIAESVEFVLKSEEHELIAEAEPEPEQAFAPEQETGNAPEPEVSFATMNPEMSISVDLEKQFETQGTQAPFIDFSVESDLTMSPPEESIQIDIPVEAPLSLQEEPQIAAPVVTHAAPTLDFEGLMNEAAALLSKGQKDQARNIYINILIQDRNYAPAIDAISNLAAQPMVAPKTNVEAPKQAMQSASDLFDLSSELQDEIHQLEEELGQPKSSQEAYLSPEEVISEFKKGVARTVAKDDYQTHYNLGIAYKEMGLLDEAISEFEMSKADKSLFMPAVSMIGICLMGKREFDQAISLYKKALQELPPVKSPEVLGLSYELAEAFVAAGYAGEAYRVFAKVAEFDPSYRDAKVRAKELENYKGTSLEKMAKKNKVSYI